MRDSLKAVMILACCATVASAADIRLKLTPEPALDWSGKFAQSVRFLDDDKLLAVGSYVGSTAEKIEIFEVASGKRIEEFAVEGIYGAAVGMDRDRRTIFCVYAGSGGIWQIVAYDRSGKSLRQIAQPKDQPAEIVEIVRTKNDQPVVVYATMKGLLLLDLVRGKHTVVEAHGKQFYPAIVCKDGTTLSSIEPNLGPLSGVALYSVPKFAELDRTIVASGWKQVRRSLSDDGSLLAIGTKDGLIRLRDVRKKRDIAEFQMQKAIQWIAFSPNGQTLAAMDGSSVGLWSVASGQKLATLPETRLGDLRNNRLAIICAQDSETEQVRVYRMEFSRIEVGTHLSNGKSERVQQAPIRRHVRRRVISHCERF